MNPPSPAGPWRLVVLGLVAGLLGGGLGIGGGMILVPLLVIAGFDQHRAHATSLAAIVFVAVTGAASFGFSGEIDVVVGVTVGLGGIIGSVSGATVMHRSSPRALTLVFSGVLFAAAIRMITGAQPVAGSAEFGDLLEVSIALVIGLLAGFFAGFAGVGGGVIIVPSSVLLLGLSQHTAQGTSLVAIIFTALAGTVVNRRNERVVLRDGVVTGLGGALGAVIGSQLALTIDASRLSSVFGFVVLVVAVRTLYRSLRMSSQEA